MVRSADIFDIPGERKSIESFFYVDRELHRWSKWVLGFAGRKAANM